MTWINEEYKRTKEVNAETERDRESKKKKENPGLQGLYYFYHYLKIKRKKGKKKKNLGSEKTKADSDNNSFSFFKWFYNFFPLISWFCQSNCQSLKRKTRSFYLLSRKMKLGHTPHVLKPQFLTLLPETGPYTLHENGAALFQSHFTLSSLCFFMFLW